MIVITFPLRRRAELSAVEFHDYWRDGHGPLVASNASALGIRRYMQLHVTDSPVGTAIAESRGCAPHVWDGIALVWFDNERQLGRAAATAEGDAAAAALLEDERRFLDLAR
ncbi:MAG: hypothetical protein QOD50_1553 [Actinomycetota bacterium]|nr:hypothetical protein [Actinomycetota bacterium]